MDRVDGPVVVVGAGIGGLAAAIALDRAGVPVEVYERARVLTEVGAGIGLWPNAIRALDRLGVDGVRALAVGGTSGAGRTAAGRVLVAMSPELLHGRYGAPTTGIMRTELQRELADTFGPDRIHLGCELVDHEDDGDGVTARFRDGTSAHGRVLVGADGLRSVVRRQLLGDGPPRYRGDTAWRGAAPADADLPPITELFETLGRGARFGVFPLHDGRTMWFAGAVRPEGERDAPDPLAELRRRFGGWHDPIPQVLAASDPDWTLRNDIYDRPPTKRWVHGRVALLGDAAHPMGPDLGQGACQAIEDAETLGLALAAFADPAHALRVYERVRMPRVRLVGRLVAATATLANRTSRPACDVRDVLLGLTPAAVTRRELDLVAGWDPPARLRAAAAAATAAA